MYSNTVSISQEVFNKIWGSPENYCQYSLSTMSNEELKLLKLLADENGIIYFTIYLDTVTLQIPINIKDLFKEPDLLEFITSVTTQLSFCDKDTQDTAEQNMYDDEM
jgi:hypothetical protein